MAGTLVELVTVVVDGYELKEFQEIDCRRSLQDAAIAFSLTATHSSWSPAAKKLRNAENIEVYASGDLICMGGVDSYEADIGEGEHKTITLHGRSHARDVIDSPPVNHPTGRSENKTLLGHAQDLGAEFEVDWSADVSMEIIEKIQLVPGEKMFQAIERQARAEGLMLLGKPDGGILITRAATKRHSGSLIEGMPPVNRVSIKLNPANEPSEVVTRGQRARGTGQENLRQEQRFKPSRASGKRHRPHLRIIEGDRGANKLHTRGKWHHLRSFGNGNLVSPRVSRWRDQDGTLWEPGRLMAIAVPSEDIDMDMTLSEVTLRQSLGDDGGTRAELVFVDPRSHGGGAPMTGTDGQDDDEFDPGASLDGSDQ